LSTLGAAFDRHLSQLLRAQVSVAYEKKGPRSVTGRILLAEDDSILSDFIALGLRQQGYVVEAVTSATLFREAAAGQPFGLWILDRRLPDGDGLQSLRDLRSKRVMTPALVLTAMGQLDQRVEGFDAGADDYLTKPFSIAELVVRVRALLRRAPTLAPSILRTGPLELHLDAGRVFTGGCEIVVTANEWRLLRLLTGRPGVTFPREAIAAEVGISDEAGLVAVDHLVSRLRTKLRACGGDKHLKTLRGLGFGWTETV
jgi:two-component system OmpR family response regulator